MLESFQKALEPEQPFMEGINDKTMKIKIIVHPRSEQFSLQSKECIFFFVVSKCNGGGDSLPTPGPFSQVWLMDSQVAGC